MAASGETVTYGQLDARSNQGAHLLRILGVEAGDAIAIFMDNSPRYYEVLWAAQRSGVRFTCISSKLTAGEVEYIVKDSEAKVFVASTAVAEVALAGRAADPGREALHGRGGARARTRASRTRARPFPTTPDRRRERRLGHALFFRHHRPAQGRQAGGRDRRPQPIDTPNPLAMIGQALYGWTPTRSICRPRRSITPPRSAGRWPFRPWAAPW